MELFIYCFFIQATVQSLPVKNAIPVLNIYKAKIPLGPNNLFFNFAKF